MKAVIRRDRETGWWHWDITGSMTRITGERSTWAEALAGALDDLRWLSRRELAWPEDLIRLEWKS